MTKSVLETMEFLILLENLVVFFKKFRTFQFILLWYVRLAEYATSRARHAWVFGCFLCSSAFVRTCFACLRAYVLMCLFRFCTSMLAFLACTRLHAYPLACLDCFGACVPNMVGCLVACLLTCLRARVLTFL